MPSSVSRSIRISGQSEIVMMRATIGRRSFSTTARARIDRKVRTLAASAARSVQNPIAAKRVNRADPV